MIVYKHAVSINCAWESGEEYILTIEADYNRFCNK